ncbi:MAG: hypothetical protein SP1CHLAM54_15520 [Chlamydiia bacterium]|nr:hypothetical protein [Chlamydiia bacterium]MCH9616442.1 hypothetical protein [Chlamydiia bacterium]MCH9629572.1 hypothetical protein [Chlamydiia bacterium]
MQSLHKWFILFLLVILPLFILRESRLLLDKKGVSYAVDEDFYQINPHDPNDKTFVVVVVTENDSGSIEATLHSIFSQTYQGYRVVVIDGGSTDDTPVIASEFAKQCRKETRLEVLGRDNPSKVYEAYYQYVLECPDNDIIVHLPAGDFFSGTDVLASLNDVYKNQDVWLTYPQYLSYPNYKKGINQPRPQKPQCKKRVERAPWVTSPLRTYYASLLKQVYIDHPETLLSVDGEKNLMIPMAEIAKYHVRFIKQVYYIHASGKHEHKLTYNDRVQLIYFGSAEDLTAFTSQFSGIDKITLLEKGADPTTVMDCDYILIAYDQVDLKRQIDLKKCIAAMQSSDAYVFSFKTPGGVNLSDAGYFGRDIYTWTLGKTQDTIKAGLYRHKDLIDKAALKSRLGLFYSMPQALR